MRIALAILFMIFSSTARAQDHAVTDSLSDHLLGEIHDTDRVNTLNALAATHMHLNTDTAVLLSLRALSLAQENKWDLGIVRSVNQLGVYQWIKGDYQGALDYFHEALSIFDHETERSRAIAILGNIGIVYSLKGDYHKALEYLFEALSYAEEIGDEKSMSINYGNIGNMYKEQGEPEKSLEYKLKSLQMAEKLGNKRHIAVNLGNLGIQYSEQGTYDKALEYAFRALELNEEMGNKSLLAANYGSLGIVYKAQGKYEESFTNYIKAIALFEELGSARGVAVNLGNLGILQTAMGSYTKAEKNLRESVDRSLELESKSLLSMHYKGLSDLYDSIHLPGKAFKNYKMYILYQDSVKNEENTKAQTRTEMKYEYQKAELIEEQEEKEAGRIIADTKRRRDNLQYSIIFLCLLVLASLVLGLGKLALPARVAEGLIFFSFLIFFEFILVLAEPYIEVWSSGAPGVKLLFNAGIAALIFPLHAFFEGKLKGRLMN